VFDLLLATAIKGVSVVPFNSKPQTQQQVALWILEILVTELHLKPGDEVPFQKLKERYRARGGDSANIKDGLEFATRTPPIMRGWSIDGPPTVSTSLRKAMMLPPSESRVGVVHSHQR
jgi:hypothetical protein